MIIEPKNFHQIGTSKNDGYVFNYKFEGSEPSHLTKPPKTKNAKIDMQHLVNNT